MIQLLSDAFEARRMILASPGQSLNQIAARETCCRTRLAKLLRLSWLSPRLVELAVAGTQPKGMTKKNLLGTDLPLDWSEQERVFGLEH
ncbi:hypothetical protein [Novosphingobium olei]|uniref:Uncharacterized protein n=1 Tax=Novosphingobium olei TaxID=2728851 RepID=A0A7Y0BRU8_9SPHN|nr:hypothetical protein [Novosphingobium olei]NML95298.1 hypothetical protein [Novosphingobium olei]